MGFGVWDPDLHVEPTFQSVTEQRRAVWHGPRLRGHVFKLTAGARILSRTLWILAMPNIIVTGGAGFIGSHLCEALLRRGDDVTAIDNFDDFYPPAIKRNNLSSIINHPRFTLMEGDIRDENIINSAVDSTTDAVIHLAARAGVRPSIADPLLYQDVNVRGTLTLLEACRRHPQIRFIFASSSSVYGNNAKVPFSEDDPVDEPISPYAATKRAGELLCRTYHHLFGFPTTCLRFFTVYGPRQRPDLAIHKFVRLIEAGRPIPVYGDGAMSRDFTYIDDIIEGVIQAIDRGRGFAIYNLGESSPMTVLDLIRAIEIALGKRAKVEHHPPQPGDVERTFAGVTRAGRDLGYSPKTDVHTGLRRFVDWFRRDAILQHAECDAPTLKPKSARGAVVPQPASSCT